MKGPQTDKITIGRSRFGQSDDNLYDDNGMFPIIGEEFNFMEHSNHGEIFSILSIMRQKMGIK